ncbi:MAG: HDOD domain-containing protein [Pseudomonadales bacterium]
MQSFHLARQPIYDRHLRVGGYELLFRPDAGAGDAGVVDGDRATSEVISTGIVDIGLERLVGTVPAFINVTARFLQGELPLPQRKGQIVLEVLEDIPIDEALVARLRELSTAGYRLALDDFVFRPGCEALLPMVDYVKLDVLALGEDALGEYVTRLRPYGALLLAEKVETHEVMTRCAELGFDLFQGYFFCRPKIITGKRPEASRVTVMHLLARIRDPEASLDELEQLVSRDPAISFRLLRYINSAYCAVSVEVTSIRQALVLVGTRQVRDWATLMLMSRLSDDKPSELMVTALVRARLCERLGQGLPGYDRSQCFTLGLLSVLDALLDQPMADVVGQLPLDEATRDALVGEPGPLGTLLAQVLAYEQGRFTDAGEAAGRLAPAYVDALAFADAMQQNMGA